MLNNFTAEFITYPLKMCQWSGYNRLLICAETDDYFCFVKNTSYYSLAHTINAFIGMLLVGIQLSKTNTKRDSFSQILISMAYIFSWMTGYEMLQEAATMLALFGPQWQTVFAKDEWVPGDTILGDPLSHFFGCLSAAAAIWVLDLEAPLTLSRKTKHRFRNLIERTALWWAISGLGDVILKVIPRQDLVEYGLIFRADLLMYTFGKFALFLLVYSWDSIRYQYDKTTAKVTDRTWIAVFVITFVYILLSSWIWTFPWILGCFAASIISIILISYKFIVYYYHNSIKTIKQ